MPYCPKCDMEFVEGVTVCTDCGGPLVNSKEEADAILQAEKEKQEEENLRRYKELMEAQNEAQSEIGANEVPPPVRTRAYVRKGQRYEDMNSSAFAFFLVGGIMAVVDILSLINVLNLPISGISGYIFHGLLTLMAVGFLAIGFSSKKSAGALKDQAADEEKETEEILQWFLKTYSARDLDDQILMEDPELSEEELSLKRFELIQDYLITGRDLPDQSYADALCDMIYGRLYENN